MKAAIGILGGTFAPFHNGHLRLAIEARERLGLEAVHVVTSARPPHRGTPAVPARRRHVWVEMAVDGDETLHADARELARDAPSYTVDTLAALRKERPRIGLCLILGSDAFNHLHTWHRWQELPELANLIVIPRPDAPIATDARGPAALRERWVADAAELLDRDHGRWAVLHLPPLAISSSAIRTLLKQGRSVRGLVPDAVLRSFNHEDIRLLTQDEESPSH